MHSLCGQLAGHTQHTTVSLKFQRHTMHDTQLFRETHVETHNFSERYMWIHTIFQRDTCGHTTFQGYTCGDTPLFRNTRVEAHNFSGIQPVCAHNFRRYTMELPHFKETDIPSLRTPQTARHPTPINLEFKTFQENSGITSQLQDRQKATSHSQDNCACWNHECP